MQVYTDAASKKKRRVDRLMGHWLPEENASYLSFLESFELSFKAKGLRRRDKVFKAMAKAIRSRDPEQCRSHHQKMEKKYETFEGLLEALREEHKSGAQAVVDTDPNTPVSKDYTVETDSQEQSRVFDANAFFLQGEQQFLRGVDTNQVGRLPDPNQEISYDDTTLMHWEEDIFGMLNL